ncbi:ABC transporter ATP-binding protein [Deinococcus sp. UYEF24]
MVTLMLSARDLKRSVGGRLLWQNLSLDVRAGDSVTVTGPSGSGKSLFLRALAGLDPLEGGDVLLNGKSQAEWAMPSYRSRVMYLPQRPAFGSGAGESGTVLDELRRPFALKAHAGKVFVQAEAERWVQMVGRPGAFLSFEVATLSGGEAQVVALVRALLLSPAVLLLDEATSALDPEATRSAEATLRHWLSQSPVQAASEHAAPIQGAPARALIWVSHDPSQRQRVAEREFTVVPT